MDWMEAEGESYSDAINTLLMSLGADRSEVDIEEMGEKKKLFGFGKKVFCVRGKLKQESFDGSAGEDVSMETLSAEIAKIGGADISENAASGKAFLEKVLTEIGIEKASVRVNENSETVVFDIVSGSGGLVIGRKGETLEALQTIMDIFLIRKKGARQTVIVDTENYRERRKQKLLEIAEAAAKEVLATGKKFPLKPMQSSERKVIHAALQGNSGVDTRSEGSGEGRRVVVIPSRN